MGRLLAQVLAVSILVLAGCASNRISDNKPGISVKKNILDDNIHNIVRDVAARHDVPEDLILGVISVESGFDPNARSRAGARGLMQLMPRTAASIANRIGCNNYAIEDIVTDPEFNIEAGTYYLSYLIKQFRSVKLALAAYNAGPGRVRRWQRAGQPLPAFSQRYVAAVLAARKKYQHSEDHEPMDQQALRALLKRSFYGDRPDEPLPDEAS